MSEHEIRATTKYLRVSPRKMRQVIKLIRGKTVEESLDLLAFVPAYIPSIYLGIMNSTP